MQWSTVRDWAGDAWALVVDRWHVSTTVSGWLLVSVVVMALALAVTPGVWRVTRQAATIIHEAGHAVVARLVGRKVLSIKLHTDTSGVMFSAGKPTGLGVLATMMAGYPAPTILGAGLAISYAAGYAGAGLTVYQVALLVTAWLCSNVVGLVSVLAASAITGVLWCVGPTWLVSATVAGLAVFYAVAGVRCMAEVTALHVKAHQAGHDTAAMRAHVATTDASQAATAVWWLPLPAGFWLICCFVLGFSSLALVVDSVIYRPLVGG